MLKGLNDFLDKHEGREIGSSTKAIKQERKRQGYDSKSKALEGKKKRPNVDIKKKKEFAERNPQLQKEMEHLFRRS